MSHIAEIFEFFAKARSSGAGLAVNALAEGRHSQAPSSYALLVVSQGRPARKLGVKRQEVIAGRFELGHWEQPLMR